MPETFNAAQGLLQFGLQGTDIETFISIAEGEKHKSIEELNYTYSVRSSYISVLFACPEIAVVT